jgi:hypothetical protein
VSKFRGALQFGDYPLRAARGERFYFLDIGRSGGGVLDQPKINCDAASMKIFGLLSGEKQRFSYYWESGVFCLHL